MRRESKDLPVSVSLALERTPPGERERLARAVTAQIARLSSHRERLLARIQNVEQVIEASPTLVQTGFMRKREQMQRELVVLNDTLRELRTFARERGDA